MSFGSIFTACLLASGCHPQVFSSEDFSYAYITHVKHILIKFALDFFLQIASYTKAQVSSLEDMRRHVSES
jgi:hypothetical protein